MTRCIVLKCSEIEVHRIPKDKKIRRLWLKAIRREDLVPTNDSRLCRKHFVESDYEKISKYTGVEHQHKYLKKSAVPSVFAWNTQPVSEKAKITNILRLFSTQLLLADHETVHYYTGLETSTKFSLVLSTLVPMANHLKYRWSQVICLSVEDQFLMLLIKLRRNTTDFELSKIFCVSTTEVSNIIVTWINFVNDVWSLVDI
ncbi:uncharacterized protein LOC111354063 [Spodoptera litura]|uniref:Uncharacterized protein LOC111354063 n=1 Tax=Spodoptera litura TaxID=69820 RepID=A0A9J7E788_SPOLT|nr:uncharacterized protein LOC111354063 [Spodoptera litura]